MITHGFDIKSVRTASRNDEASMRVRKLPDLKRFEEESTLFASINESYGEGHVEVYAPVSWKDRTQRTRELKDLGPLIREALESSVAATAPKTGGPS